ncbi:MAG: DNA-directed RNA polymerase subunit beta' [bacterium]
MLFENENEFESLTIGLASPEKIRYWSYGEIEKPETINYRTFKAERKGLFCERVFGPVKDWECACGKYRRIRYRGVVCERCGVEVTHSKVRRERMGHIELATPVSHIWFLKGIPSYLSIILDMSTRKIEEIVYYDAYVVINVDPELEGQFRENQLISINEYLDIKEKYKDTLTLDIGARAIKKILKKMDLQKLANTLRESIVSLKGQKRLKVAKRLRIIDALLSSENKPEWMILDAIPVMPPDLRPMVQLDGGRFATSDLNDLYRRIINRNNRLKRLMDIGAPDMIIRNEKRMLQEAVDVLISNGKRGRAVTGTNGRPLKSLGNIIEGKQGRFRQNLLGKRVDYSARSVIVVGPHLKFHQCGLPKEICIELFKPHVIRELVKHGIVSNVKNAKRKIEERGIEIWEILEKVIKKQPVLLNRAPTLHRLGIQAFEPVIVEGSAIQIHPLVCTAFNADFDGDQMAVHLPIGLKAKAECRFLVLSTNNILSPSSGSSIITPTQDMVLGCYYLTVDNQNEKRGENKYYTDMNEILRAHELGFLGVQSRVRIKERGERIETTVGRIIFNITIREIIKEKGYEEPEWINDTLSKKVLSDLVYDWYVKYGNTVTALLADKIKDIGFNYAMLSGISISVDDLTIPDKKEAILQQAQKEVEHLDKQLKKNIITSNEKRRQSNDIWRSATQQVSDALEKEMGELNNVYIMANSGARGNIDQVRQLAGMRGLMSDSQGRTVEIPIRSNFKEGLKLTEYFISCYGARKGLVDTALRTADSGYLTRRLVDVAQDVIITEEDCGTTEGLTLTSIKENGQELISLASIIEGRISLETIKSEGNVIIESGEMITRYLAKKIQDLGIKSIKTRNVFNCNAKKGICQKCYGIDLATAKLINLGEAVGIIAAQSIGEPGTQLTMRTFHTGGVDLRKAAKVEIKSSLSGEVKFKEPELLVPVKDRGTTNLIAIEDTVVQVKDKKNKVKSTNIPKNSAVIINEGVQIKDGDVIAEFDASMTYTKSEKDGIVKFMITENKNEKDLIDKKENIALQTFDLLIYDPNNVKELLVNEKAADKCKVGERVPKDICEKLKQPILIVKSITEDKDSKTKQKFRLLYYEAISYAIEKGVTIYVGNDERVNKSDILFKQRTDDDDLSKTQDIVQGLPRVEELFEARKNKEVAILADIDAVVEIENRESYKALILQGEDTLKEYKLPLNKRVLVYSGQKVSKGEQITEGVINPHDILATKGVFSTQRYLSEQVLGVYKSQGVEINLKHIEIIVRQMTKKIIILESGDSILLPNEMVDIQQFEEINRELKKEGKQEAIGKRELLGVTRSSLNTQSFIASSSFQQTAGVLTTAAVKGSVDEMYGLKENVIIGNLIPAGTGFERKSNFSIKISENAGA